MQTVSQGAQPPLPGLYWPEQQGWYAGIARSEDGQSHWHLILPDATPETDFVSIWGTYGQKIDGASSRHNGMANTEAMAAAGCPAARKVLVLRGGLHIPSQAELQLLCATLHDKFNQRDWYWSSTQGSAHSAFVQGFDVGNSLWGFKDGESRVRAVRGLALQPFSTSTVPGILA